MAGAPHYFEPDPLTRSRPGSTNLTLPDVTLTLATDAAVFSAGAVDAGTKLLLLDGPRPADEPGADLLDLGCGYGPIALTLARRAPAATVWAVDVNRRALALCAANAEAAGVTNVRAVEPEAVPDDVSFAGIWSNPPIRIGKAGLHDLLLGWLPRLAPDGGAWLVVHKHLGSDSLASWLGHQGYAVQRLRSRGGYRILGVRRGT